MAKESAEMKQFHHVIYNCLMSDRSPSMTIEHWHCHSRTYRRSDDNRIPQHLSLVSMFVCAFGGDIERARGDTVIQ